MLIHTHEISNSLFLNLVKTSSEPLKKRDPVNHILVIDCSGSMSYELPLIREQIKKKVPKIIHEDDTLSIIWFSGSSEHGVLLSGEKLSSLKDLNDVNNAVDRWLKPVGLTGFVGPLKDAFILVESLKKKNPGSFSLFFMSDGHDNQSSQDKILDTINSLKSVINSATFVEYGYYCNRPLMSKMASMVGGELILSENFDSYAPALENVFSKNVNSTPRVEVKVTSDATLAFSLSDNSIFVYEVYEKDGENFVSVPDGTEFSYYSNSRPNFKNSIKWEINTNFVISCFYASLNVYGMRMDSNMIYKILSSMGDVKFIKLFSSCFGKQKYKNFCDLAKEAAFGKGRFEEGTDVNFLPKEDAYTILDLLEFLVENNAGVQLDHESFKYNRISRARVESSSSISDSEKEEIKSLASELSNSSNLDDVRSIQEKINAIIVNRPYPPSMKFKTSDVGYPIRAIKYNEERPNISFSVIRDCVVNLGTTPPDLDLKNNKEVNSFVFRDYSIITDGIVNIKKLPIYTKKPSDFVHHFNNNSVSFTITEDNTMEIDLTSLPVINRSMVRNVSAHDLGVLEYNLTKMRAHQKIYNHFSSEVKDTKSNQIQGYNFGEPELEFLSSIGITKNGYAPKTVYAPSSDFYLGKQVSVSLKGYSKLPSMKELEEQIKKNKLNGPGRLMKEALDGYNTYSASSKPETLKSWIELQQKICTENVRSLIQNKAKIIFSLVLGQTWFTEFSSLDENTLKFNFAGEDLELKIDMKEIEIKL